MRKATIYRYRIPMTDTGILRQQRLDYREGAVICLEDGSRQGWGEIAPLPGFSQETLQQALEESIWLLTRWQVTGVFRDSHLPSVAFATSCAQAELDEELPDIADYQTVALLRDMPNKADLAVAPHAIAKLKVGFGSVERDAQKVSRLLSSHPTLRLRLDANRSWSLAQAVTFTQILPKALHAQIDFIEEPCRNVTASREFYRMTGVPIAWDEQVRETDFVLKAEQGVEAIIIKPTLQGGLSQCRKLIEQAQQQGMTAVISASIESSLGLTQLARIAHWLTPHVIPGLDTLSLMQNQLIRVWPHSKLAIITEQELPVLWHS